MPWAGDTHLLSAILRREFGDRMKVFLGRLCAVKLRFCGYRLPFTDATLHPDLADIIFLPIGKEADAVAARHNRFEVLLQFTKREVFINYLLNLIGWLDLES